jgi:N6-L-threonylcarbamoyladenine synthase
MLGEDRVPTMSEKEKADIAASFQAAVVDVLVNKTIQAANQVHAQTILLGGGVAANSRLREQLQDRCTADDRRLLIAAKKYCTDNAAMVAGLAHHKLKAGITADLYLEALPHQA